MSSPYRKSGRSRNVKGRSTTNGPFIQITHFMYDSPAYRSLPPQDRVLLQAVMRRYNGANNGMIGLGVREAATECNVNKDTAAKGFRRLMDKGFLVCTTPGGFSVKLRLASEWRLTLHRCDKSGELPTKDFMRWQPEVSKPKTRPRPQEAPKPAVRVAA